MSLYSGIIQILIAIRISILKGSSLAKIPYSTPLEKNKSASFLNSKVFSKRLKHNLQFVQFLIDLRFYSFLLAFKQADLINKKCLAKNKKKDRYLEIDETSAYIISLNNEVLKYQENTDFKNLRKRYKCIFYNGCTFIYKNITEIF